MTWASVNEPSSEVPRWPEVPNATGARGGPPVGLQQRVDVHEVVRLGQLAGAGVGAHGPDCTPSGTVRDVRPDERILVAGEALVDLVPAADGTLSPYPGGGPFTTARALGRLGRPVAFAGRLSTDRFGERMAAMLAADGVALDAAERTDDPTTLALAEVDAAGAAAYRFYTEGTSAPGLRAADLDAAAVLHVGHAGAGARADGVGGRGAGRAAGGARAGHGRPEHPARGDRRRGGVPRAARPCARAQRRRQGLRRGPRLARPRRDAARARARR